MAHGSRLVDLVHERIEEFLAERTSILRSISPDLDPLDGSHGGFSAVASASGRCSAIGAGRACARRDFDPFEPDGGARSLSRSSRPPRRSSSSMPRRSCTTTSSTAPTPAAARPSAHRLFESLHAESGWTGSAAEFGTDAAILLGDLLLGWSDELLDEGLDVARRPPCRADGARRVHAHAHRGDGRPVPRHPRGARLAHAARRRAARCAPSASSSSSRRSTASRRRC